MVADPRGSPFDDTADGHARRLIGLACRPPKLHPRADDAGLVEHTADEMTEMRVGVGNGNAVRQSRS